MFYINLTRKRSTPSVKVHENRDQGSFVESQSEREKIGNFFIILLDSRYLQESVVQKKKIEKIFHTPKSSKTLKIFELKF